MAFFDCAGWNPSAGTVVLWVMDLGGALMNKRVFSVGWAYNAGRNPFKDLDYE